MADANTLVARLRKRYEEIDQFERQTESILLEAADTIERLESELDGLRHRRGCGNNFGGHYCTKPLGHSGLHGNEGANWS